MYFLCDQTNTFKKEAGMVLTSKNVEKPTGC